KAWFKSLESMPPKSKSEASKAGAGMNASGTARGAGARTGAAWVAGDAAAIRDGGPVIGAAMAAAMSGGNAAGGKKKHGSGDWQSSRHEVGAPWVAGVVSGITERMQLLAAA